VSFKDFWETETESQSFPTVSQNNVENRYTTNIKKRWNLALRPTWCSDKTVAVELELFQHFLQLVELSRAARKALAGRRLCCAGLHCSVYMRTSGEKVRISVETERVRSVSYAHIISLPGLYTVVCLREASEPLAL